MYRLAVVIYAVLTSVFAFQLVVAEYPACGTDSDITEAGLENNIADHVTRLMSLKSSSGVWENTPEVVLAVLLSQPESFTNLTDTVEKMEQELLSNGATMSIGQFSQYVLSAKATCRNLTNFGGMNLPKKLKQGLEKEFTYNEIKHNSPRNGWYGVFLALGAYCATQKESPVEFFIHRALHAQNRDGSFDQSHSIDHTSQAMFSLICLSRTNTMSHSLQSRVDTSLKMASTYIKSRITTQRDNVWLANKYASSVGVVAVKEHADWGLDAWRCALVMKSLNRPHDPKEGESAIAQRLLALTGSSYLAMMEDDYQCIGPGTSNSAGDSRPIETEEEVACDSEEEETSNLVTIIDVHIHIHPNAHSTVTSEPIALILRDLRKGKTLLEMIRLAQCRGLMTFKTETTAWGEYITTVNGVEARSDNKEYWAILNNGVALTVGVGQFKPSHSDRISFKLKRWQ